MIMTDQESNKSAEQLAAKIEAVLFIHGDPMPIKKIASAVKAGESAVKDALRVLGESFEDERRGLFLVQEGERVQLATKPVFAKLFEDLIKEELTENLTPASLETLTIICYTAPVTRAEIDYIRGVNSSFILRSLLLRGLIDRNEDQKRGNAFVYAPSFELLKFLGIAKAADLPEYEHFRGLVKNFKAGGESAATLGPAVPPSAAVGDPLQ